MLRSIARRPWAVVWGPAALSLLVSVSTALFVGWPVPKIHDEFSYLLAAETFASGRLTNPTPPHWPHFEAFQVLLTPSYMSKYPPAQGLAMAAGIMLTGEPIAGVWVTGALAAAAVAWALIAYLPRPWAFVGGLVVALHPIVLTWNQCYWGGSIALGAGALLIGAVRRLSRREPHARSRRAPAATQVGATLASPSQPGPNQPNHRDRADGPATASQGDARVAPTTNHVARNAALAAIALAILANARPYEGLLLAVLVLVPFALRLVRERGAAARLRQTSGGAGAGPSLTRTADARPHPNPLSAGEGTRRSVGLPAGVMAAILVANFAWMAVYNHAVTGSATRLPYVEYESQYAITPALVVLPAPPDKTYRNETFDAYYRGWERPQYEKQDALAKLPGAFGEKAGTLASKLVAGWGQWNGDAVPAWANVLRLPIALSLIALPLALWTTRRLRGPAVASVLFLAGSFLALWFFPHYAAPIGAYVVLLHVAALRAAWLAWGRPGRAMVYVVLTAHVIDAGVHVLTTPAPIADTPNVMHTLLADEKQAGPDRWLLIVRSGPGVQRAHTDLVANGPDVVNAKVVFARDLGEASNAELIRDYAGRGYRIEFIDRVAGTRGEITPRR
jgi:hypothetical protein